MVNMAKYFLEFSLEESCGQCVPCRVGLKQMYDLLEKITLGTGTMADLEKLEQPRLHGARHLALRPGAGGAQPGHLDHQVFQARIPRAHPGQEMLGRRLRRPVPGALRQRLPRRRRRRLLRLAHGRRPPPRSLLPAHAEQPLPDRLRPRLPRLLREEVLARQVRRGPGHPRDQAAVRRLGHRRGARFRPARPSRTRRRSPSSAPAPPAWPAPST